MNSIDTQYQFLLKDILENGVKKEDRTGTGTLSVFGRTIRHNMKEGFPLLTTKKMAVKSMITELRWFLKGDTNIKYLVDNGCNIWNGDTYKNYCKVAGAYEEPDYDVHVEDLKENKVRLLTQKEFIERIKTDDEFAKKWGELGPIYGSQWKSWYAGSERQGSATAYYYHDQIKHAIQLLHSNPDSRRIMVNSWNLGQLDEMVLPPCHYNFQLYTRELSLEERGIYYESNYKGLKQNKTHEQYDEMDIPKRAISLKWNQRSVDTFLGLPFNIASYALLLMLFADEVNMIPEEVIGDLGDTHLYLNHVEQAKEQITREPKELPILKILDHDGAKLWGNFDVEITNYNPHPVIKASLSN